MTKAYQIWAKRFSRTHPKTEKRNKNVSLYTQLFNVITMKTLQKPEFLKWDVCLLFLALLLSSSSTSWGQNLIALKDKL